MTLQDLEFPSSFFEDEAREGFFVPSMMKRNWACQLEILKVIDTICKRHGISWFMDSGTLLGAVRHHGFIPWDDDIDIIMRRSDQLRFIEAAATELPEGYVLKNPDKDLDASNSNLTLFNSDLIDTSSKRMERFHGFPYGVCVDIFTLDGVHENPAEHEQIHAKIDKIRDAITLLKENRSKSKEFKDVLLAVEKENKVNLSTSKHLEGDLWRLMRKQHMTVSDVGSKKLEFFWKKENRYIHDAACYAETCMLPFEFMSLPAPVGYQEVLRTLFGDYSIIVRQAKHSYPVYGGQEKKLAADIGCNPFRYTMTRENVFASRGETPLQRTEKVLEVLKRACTGLETVGTDTVEAEKLLLAMQKLTANILNWVGNQPLNQVQILSRLIFDAYLEWKPELAKNILTEIQKVHDVLVSEYESRNEILFLITRSAWWPQTERLIHHFEEMETGANIIFMKIPLYLKNQSANTRQQVNQEDEFPCTVHMMNPEEYDIETRHPSKIVTQFPFDGTNTALTTDENFFSQHLKNCTDELIYAPCYEVDVPTANDMAHRYTLRTLIEEPAVAFADKILLNEAQMRSFYIEVLKSIVGRDTQLLWEDKIQII